MAPKSPLLQQEQAEASGSPSAVEKGTTKETAEAKKVKQDNDIVWIKALSAFLCVLVLVLVVMPVAIFVAPRRSSEPNFQFARDVFNSRLKWPVIGAWSCLVAWVGWKCMDNFPEKIIIKFLRGLLCTLMFVGLPMGICMHTMSDKTVLSYDQFAQSVAGPLCCVAAWLVVGVLAKLVAKGMAAKEEAAWA